MPGLAIAHTHLYSGLARGMPGPSRNRRAPSGRSSSGSGGGSTRRSTSGRSGPRRKWRFSMPRSAARRPSSTTTSPPRSSAARSTSSPRRRAPWGSGLHSATARPTATAGRARRRASPSASARSRRGCRRWPACTRGSRPPTRRSRPRRISRGGAARGSTSTPPRTAATPAPSSGWSAPAPSGRKTILAHGVHLTASERERAAEAGAWIVHNPRSNLQNAVGYANVATLGPRVALGTDGMDGDLFAEARAAHLRGRDAYGPQGGIDAVRTRRGERAPGRRGARAARRRLGRSRLRPADASLGGEPRGTLPLRLRRPARPRRRRRRRSHRGEGQVHARGRARSPRARPRGGGAALEPDGVSVLRPLPLSVLVRRAAEELPKGAVFDLPARRIYKGFPGTRPLRLLPRAPRGHARRPGLRPAHAARPEHRAVVPGGRPDPGAEDRPGQRPPRHRPPVHRHAHRRLQHRVVAGARSSPIRCASTRRRGSSSRSWTSSAAYRQAERDVVFDVSVGYDLEGIRSRKMAGFFEGVRDATALLDAERAKLRRELPSSPAPSGGPPCPTRLSDSTTLSTFHGCPADEIAGICRFLLNEAGLHTIVKLNPTLLGYGASRGDPPRQARLPGDRLDPRGLRQGPPMEGRALSRTRPLRAKPRGGD